MTQQRKIRKYRGAVLKIVPSGPMYMEWRIVMSDGRVFYDPTSCPYSVRGMNHWLTYAQDKLDWLLEEPPKRKPFFKIEKSIWMARLEAKYGFLKQEQQNGSISGREIEP